MNNPHRITDAWKSRSHKESQKVGKKKKKNIFGKCVCASQYHVINVKRSAAKCIVNNV